MEMVVETHSDQTKHWYTITHQTVDGGDSWVYRPTDLHPHMKEFLQDLATIRRVAKMLPPVDLPIDPRPRDYPDVSKVDLKSSGMNYHNTREIFVLGGHIFMRRYNDDWSPEIMYTVGYSTWSVCPHPFIHRLEEMLKIKSYESITYDDIKSLMK